MPDAELPPTSYEELAGLVVSLAARVDALEAENAGLRRRLGMNSSNAGTPTSKEGIEAAAERKAVRQASQRVRSSDRKPGGQKGRKGAGLQPAGEPELDDTDGRLGPRPPPNVRALAPWLLLAAILAAAVVVGSPLGSDTPATGMA